jgi:hypothetical protein
MGKPQNSKTKKEVVENEAFNRTGCRVGVPVLHVRYGSTRKG